MSHSSSLGDQVLGSVRQVLRQTAGGHHEQRRTSERADCHDLAGFR